MTIKNFFAFALIAAATVVISSDCNAQDREGRQGPPGGGPGGGGPRGPHSPEEMMSHFPVLKALDADGNGEISTSEMESAATALATLDKNSDGILEASELMPTRGPRGEGGGRGGRGEGGPRGEGGGRGGRGEGGGRGGDSEGFLNRMMENDTDGDGKVSLAEAPERMQGFFERMDGDSDGFLTREEITEASNRFRGGGGGGRGGEGQRPRRPSAE